MKRYVILIYLTFVFLHINVNKTDAQVDSKLSGFLPSYSTISPSSLYNGIPDINIPLYTLNARGISIPVSISYDPSGITVHQEASSVGLG